MPLITASLVAENTFTAPLGHMNAAQGDIAISVSGTFVGTLTLQRSLDGGTTWGDDATTYTAAAEISVVPTAAALYRIGFKTGAFTSGVATIQVK